MCVRICAKPTRFQTRSMARIRHAGRRVRGRGSASGRGPFKAILEISADAYALLAIPDFMSTHSPCQTFQIDISHKVLRTQTARDLLYEATKKAGGARFKEEAQKLLIGQIVLTRYNNRSYKIGKPIALIGTSLYCIGRLSPQTTSISICGQRTCSSTAPATRSPSSTTTGISTA